MNNADFCCEKVLVLGKKLRKHTKLLKLYFKALLHCVLNYVYKNKTREIKFLLFKS